MSKVEIYWEEIDAFNTDIIDNYSCLNEILKKIVENNSCKILDKKGLYAIRADKKFLYIGETHEQTIKERLIEGHDVYEDIFDCLSYYKCISVFAGEITPISQEKLSDKLIEDTEACLIFNYQPEFNTQNMNKCKNPIHIKNIGDFDEIGDFKKEVTCSEKDCR